MKPSGSCQEQEELKRFKLIQTGCDCIGILWQSPLYKARGTISQLADHIIDGYETDDDGAQ